MTNSDEKNDPARFALSGGPLCLDFANSWGNQADPGSDRLIEYEHLIAFARQAGSLKNDAADALSRAATANREEALAALSFGLKLRQVIYRIFASRAGCRDVPLKDIDRINAVLGEALSHRRIERRDGGFAWSWIDIDAADLRAPIWPIIESAAALLTSDEFDRVRECAAEDCSWLFLDGSRGGNRRWCSMKSCGNRAKARRHYRRQGPSRTKHV